MRYPQGRLMVFCKAPEPGKVKTRLAKSLGVSGENIGMSADEVAAKIHEYLALHCLEKLTKGSVAPVELWCSPDRNHPFFQHCKKTFNVELKEQGEGDLGERMSRAFDDATSENIASIVVGADCPALNVILLEQAFELLHETQCSVIVPAEDGGYVLLGLPKNQPEIFMNIPWGSSRVHYETLLRIDGAVRELPKLWDIDRLEDLTRLLSESSKLGLSKDFIVFLESLKLHL